MILQPAVTAELDARGPALLAGYFTVWIVCGVTALVAAAALAFVPKTAFTDRAVADSEAAPAVP